MNKYLIYVFTISNYRNHDIDRKKLPPLCERTANIYLFNIGNMITSKSSLIEHIT